MSISPYRQLNFLAALAPHSLSRPSPFVSTTLLNIHIHSVRFVSAHLLDCGWTVLTYTNMYHHLRGAL